MRPHRVQIDRITNPAPPSLWVIWLAYYALHHALMALSASGPAGFEGFVRDILAEVSGAAFRLMKSGPQGGVDAIVEPSGNSIAIGMEGKQYASTTRLPLDALKSKLRDASATFPMLDLWVLAATRVIDGGDARALGEVGGELGVDVLVLDWSDTGAVPPALAILCAAAPAATGHHLSSSPVLLADLSSIRSNAFYAAELERLIARLRDPSTGLATSRSRLREWTRERLKDSNSARQAFDSNAVLEATDSQLVARPVIESDLDRWWASPDRPAVLLGMEGMGKTWALLAWWLARSQSQQDFPLTLVIPARDIGMTDAPTLIARALHQATGIRDAAFWERRVARWSTNSTDRPLILLAIDGLNQNWTFRGWSDLVVSARTPAWRGKIAIAFTCRPDHWENRLKSLADLEGGAEPIRVEQFNDAELDQLLSPHGLARKEIPSALLGLMRRPRLSRLAIERREALSAGDEITVERLVYEDWRHRHPGARRVLSDAEFKVFVANLGCTVQTGLDRAPLSRAELLGRLSADGGSSSEEFQIVLSELIDGGWLEPAVPPHHFRLHVERVPAALGLTLLAELKASSSLDEAHERFARLLDPLQDSDLSVAILRNAVTFALIEGNANPEIQRFLLERWIGAQNFSPVDFDAYWRLVGLAPDLALDFAEADWFGRHSQSRADEVLVKGFGNASRWPEVSDALRSRLQRWFSHYWLDWLQGEVLGQLEDDAQAEERRRGTAERAQAAADEGIAERFGLKIQLADPEGKVWGSYRAVELMSWLPRAPLIDVFTAWAITFTILGRFRQFDAMAWVLRWNEDDAAATERVILERVRELLEEGGKIACGAAEALLDALATPAARNLHANHFGCPSQPVAPSVTWKDLSEDRDLEQPLAAVATLKADPLDPTAEIPATWAKHLSVLASRTTDAALVTDDGSEARALEYSRVALARWAPASLAELVRRRFAAAIDDVCPPTLPPSRLVRLWSGVFGRKQKSVQHVKVPPTARDLPRGMLALNDSALAPWRALSQRVLIEGAAAPFDLHAAALAEASAERQIAILSKIMPEAGLPDWSATLLSPVETKDLPALAEQLEPTRPVPALLAWIEFLDAAPRGARPNGWAPLIQLIGHDDAKVRAATFELIVSTDDVPLADAVHQSGWRFTAGMDRHEAAWGSLALSMARSSEDGSMVGRVHPDALGRLLARHPKQSAYLNAFAEHVRLELEHLRTSREKVYPRSLINTPGGWDELVALRRQDFLDWMKPFLDDDTEAYGLRFFPEEFPLIRALDAVDKLIPGAKAEYIARALKSSISTDIRMNDLYRIAIDLSGAGAEEAWELVLTEANNDKKLFDLALGLQQNGQTGWLLEQIDRNLAAGTAGRIARGLVLAGFLVKSEESDAWWDAHDKPPASGWLAEVHAIALAEYRRFGNARHWLFCYRSEIDSEAALSIHELVAAGIDRRVLVGEVRPSVAEIAGWSWRRRLHWRVAWSQVDASIRKQEDKLTKRFLASKPPLQNQSPHRR